MKPNRLREKLSCGEPTLGTQIYSTWPSAVEALGHTGLYDYVEFVSEHGAFDLHDLDNLARAAELYGLGTMIKVDQCHQTFLAQRSVGAGFGAVLFTDCRSADDVRECIRTIRPDTPEDGGLYGSAIRRMAIPDHPGTAEYLQALRDTVVAIMIEKKGAVDNLDEILSVPGVDMVGSTIRSASAYHVRRRHTPRSWLLGIESSKRRSRQAYPLGPRSIRRTKPKSSWIWVCATLLSAPTSISCTTGGKTAASGYGK